MKGIVLYIGGFELPDKNAAAQRVVTNGKLLLKLGYEVFYLGLNRELKRRNSFNENSIVSDFKYWSLKYPHSFFEWYEYLTGISFIDEIIKNKLPFKPVIIIAYNYPAIALFKLKKFCSNNNIKLVADCTEWYQATGNPVYRLIKFLDTSLRMKFVHLKIDGIIAISKYLFNYYKSKSQNVVLLPPLVDKENPKWKTSAYKPGKVRRLIYAGSPGTGNKDKLDLIIKALSKVKKLIIQEFQLTVIGITETQYYNSFGSKSLPANIKNDIIFKGRLPHLETIKAIQNSDFSIFLRNESLVTLAGFPTKFVEAISCGTPVLTNATSNIKEFIVEGENGFLLDLNNFDRLVEILVNAISKTSDEVIKMKNICIKSNLFDINSYFNTLNQLIHKF